MRFVTPRVFIIGETKLFPGQLEEYWEHLKCKTWALENLININGDSAPELITEIYSRGCYKSFGPGLNPNVTKVREGNRSHLENILRSGHGSVLEHAQINFMFCDVSRVFTHELVRHRVGVAISQESLRYVRLTDLGCWIPSCFQDDLWAKAQFVEVFKYLENVQRLFADHYKLDEEKDFKRKKEITSAMRRLAPIGLATNIGWSANLRTLRHVIPLRTDPSAEEEIRVVFNKVGYLLRTRYPNVFQDMEWEDTDDGIGKWTAQYKKV